MNIKEMNYPVNAGIAKALGVEINYLFGIEEGEENNAKSKTKP